MNNKVLRWLLLGVLIFLAILFYTNLILYSPYVCIPVLKLLSINGIKDVAVTGITIVSVNFIIALIVALIFSFPLGYIMKDKPVFFGFLLGFGLLLYLLWLHVQLYQSGFFTRFNVVVTFFDYIGIISAFILMSKMGTYVRNSHERKIT
jgi:hypothetical protein